MDYERSLFGMKLLDVTSLAKALRVTETLTILSLPCNLLDDTTARPATAPQPPRNRPATAPQPPCVVARIPTSRQPANPSRAARTVAAPRLQPAAPTVAGARACLRAARQHDGYGARRLAQ